MSPADGGAPATAAELGGFALFAGSDPSELGDLAAALEPVTFAAGTTVLAAGEPGSTFLLVRTGEVVVERTAPGPDDPIALGPGTIVGELSILRGAPRAATVVARTEVSALQGGPDDLATLLAVAGVSDRMRRMVAGRLAANAEPVDVVLRDGTPVRLRPVLPTDWEHLRRALEHVSPEFFRHRFFAAGRPPDHVLRYLIDIDYAHHFAWVAVVPGSGSDSDGDEAIASGRYILRREHPGSAELALGVVDEHQGRGIGGLLVGALAAAAGAVGLERFYALTNADNRPMRSLLDRHGATWELEEPGVVATEIPIGPLLDLLPAGPREALARIATNVVAAADGLAT